MFTFVVYQQYHKSLTTITNCTLKKIFDINLACYDKKTTPIFVKVTPP